MFFYLSKPKRSKVSVQMKSLDIDIWRVIHILWFHSWYQVSLHENYNASNSVQSEAASLASCCWTLTLTPPSCDLVMWFYKNIYHLIIYHLHLNLLWRNTQSALGKLPNNVIDTKYFYALSYPHSLDEEDLCESSMGSSGANVFSGFVSCIKNMYLIDRTSVYLVAAMIVLSMMCKLICRYNIIK